MSDTAICVSCRRPNPTRLCGVCDAPVCKSCVQNLEPSSFALLPEVPKELSHIYYCQACYDEHVATELERYAEVLARAEESFTFLHITEGLHSADQQIQRSIPRRQYPGS